LFKGGETTVNAGKYREAEGGCRNFLELLDYDGENDLGQERFIAASQA